MSRRDWDTDFLICYGIYSRIFFLIYLSLHNNNALCIKLHLIFTNYNNDVTTVKLLFVALNCIFTNTAKFTYGLCVTN